MQSIDFDYYVSLYWQGRTVDSLSKQIYKVHGKKIGLKPCRLHLERAIIKSYIPWIIQVC
jgi:hypothetical protein